MLTQALEPAVISQALVFRASACSMLCSATFDSERLWRENDDILLPAVNDPVHELIVSTLDELMFPFCPDEGDVLMTRHELPSSQADYLRSLGFCFENVLTDTAGQVLNSGAYENKNYFYSPYSVLPAWENNIAGLNVINGQPDLQVVKKVNSKIFSWQLRREINDNIGEACFSSSMVGAAAGKILSHGQKAILKEAFGVSGRGSIVIDSIKTLERICRFIDARERKGGKAEFVVEPLLKKTIDFSCHFMVDRHSGFTMLGLQRMRNNGFAFGKVEAAGRDFVGLLGESGYFRTVENVAQALSKEKYFGPVCLDSMMTEDGIVPIVEINARKSMGLINIRLSAHSGNPSGRCILGFYDLRVPQNFSHHSLLNRLDERHILFNKKNGCGVAILNANGITIHRDAMLAGNASGAALTAARNICIGRIYFAIISDSDARESSFEEDFKNVLYDLNINPDKSL